MGVDTDIESFSTGSIMILFSSVRGNGSVIGRVLKRIRAILSAGVLDGAVLITLGIRRCL